ncbi:MAG: PfkB family carbohydrate kinase [Candidatus Nanoarchaeia archaeon]
MEKLVDVVNGFEKKKVLVLGDAMLDKYVFGKAIRISPEAPIPVVKVDRRIYAPGGAGNTAANITSFGANAYLVSVVGDDISGRTLVDTLKNKNVDVSGIVISHIRPTTVKERVVAQSQQVVRLDDEIDDYLGAAAERGVIHKLKELIPGCDAVVVSDYAKGMVTANIMSALHGYASAKKIPIIVDPKPRNKIFYKGCEIIMPNISEAKAMVSGDYKDLSQLCLKLKEELDCHVLLTMGEYGMKLVKKDGLEFNFDAATKGVHDVTGAGDTATAILTLSLVAGASHELAAELANYAAGIVVRKFGAATTDKNELLDFIADYKAHEKHKT